MEYLLFALFLIFSNIYATSQELELLKQVECSASDFTTDNFGDLYLVGIGKIEKYNLRGEKTAESNYYQQFNFSTIDVSNSLKLVAYDSEQNAAIIFDKQLFELQTINFYELEFQTPKTICSSQRGGFWIYEKFENKLFLLDNKLKISAKTANLNFFIDTQTNSVEIAEIKGKLYSVFDSLVIIFDEHCGYITEIKAIGKIMDISANEIISIKNNKLYIENIDDKGFIEINLASICPYFIKVKKYADKLLVLENKSFKIFKIK